MNKIFNYLIFLVLFTSIYSCKKSGYGNYPGGEISPYIAIFDLRSLYKGQDVPLTKETLLGATSITGVVVSDHSGNNIPENLIMVQDGRRLSQLRGIALDLGADARSYTPGDSVIIDVEGGILKRVNGTLQISNISKSNISKLPEKVRLTPVVAPVANIINDPDRYESTLLAVVDGSFLPLPKSGDILSGEKTINDGSGNITLFTDIKATFANNSLYGRANYYGILLNSQSSDGKLIPKVCPRVKEDIILLSSNSELQHIIITGFVSDAKGADGNYEYIQFMATSDINFATTPFSVVVTNNAGASTPIGLPKNGWATGGLRTYKINITSGSTKKGAFFYVGGTEKLINGKGSTDISSANWVRAVNYTTTNGDDFGTKTGGLLANSGNASGIAVFKGTKVDANTLPVDVVMIATNGTVYDPTQPEYGYRIADNDLYKTVNLITLEPQPFFKSGNNTLSFPYNASDLGYFNQLGGRYNITMGRWTERRNQKAILMAADSPLSFIEDSFSTKLMKIEGSTEVEDK